MNEEPSCEPPSSGLVDKRIGSIARRQSGLAGLGGNDSPLTAFLRRDLTWEAMQKRGAWRVGLDPSFPPFEMLDADAAPTGFDVELAGRIAAGWGMEVEIVAIGFDSLSDALRVSKIDSIVSAYPYDERLTRDFAFSTPYFDAGLRLVVREGSSIQDVQGLTGKRVAVEMGSLGDMIGTKAAATRNAG